MGSARQQAPQQHCPNCNATVNEGDIICVQCGTNLLTGQKIAQEQRQASARRREFGRWPLFVALAVVAVVAVVLVILLPGLLSGPVARARALALEDKELEALNVLRQHISGSPEDADAQMLFGKLRWRRGDYAEAGEAFAQAARVRPDDPDAAWFAVLALQKQPGDASLQRMTGLLRGIVQRTPEDGHAWFALAVALARQGEMAGAMDALRSAADRMPDDAAVQGMLGIALANQRRFDEAMAALQTARLLGGPGDPAVSAALAVVASKQGNEEMAAGLLREAVEQGGRLGASAGQRLGLALVREGDFQEAERLLRTSAEMRKENAPGMFYHALALQGAGRPDDAANLYAQVVDLNVPQSLEAAIELSKLHLVRGDATRARERLDQAKTLLGAAQGRTESARQRLEAMYSTAEGRVLMAENRSADALRSFQRAAEADPAYPAAALERGLYYIQTGAMGEGLAELRRYLELASGVDGGRANEVAVLVRQLEQTQQTGAR
jgi:Flp pilus assembly protein TadD